MRVDGASVKLIQMILINKREKSRKEDT